MNDELSAMHDRALQAEQALIEARNYHKDEVARLKERLNAAEALNTANIQAIPSDTKMLAIFCDLNPEYLNDARELGKVVQKFCGSDALVAWFPVGASIDALNDKQLADAGLMRVSPAATTMEDNFGGSDRDLIACAQSLLNFDAAGKLVPHGIGGLAREIIEAFVSRFPRSKPSSPPVKKTVPASSKSPNWYPTPDKLWLAYGPDTGLEFYATEQEAIDAGADFIEGHIGDDGWDEAVAQVFVGKAIHIARQTDVVKRPPDDELDDDGFDEEGNDWSGDHDCRCNYRLEALDPRGSIGSSEAIKEVLNQAIMVVAYRAGDVSTEDGSYATTCSDSIIRLESALCEALGTKHDDIEINEALELLNKLELTA